MHSVQESDQSKITAGPRVLHREATEGQQTTLQSHYDTQWLAPLNFLAELRARDVIKQTFEDVRLGDIFLLPGNLSLIDLRMFKAVFGAAAERPPETHRPSGNRAQRRAAVATGSQSTSASSDQQQDNFGLRLLSAMEQPAFLNFQSKGRKFWSIAESEAIVGDGRALLLKHGISFPGVWQLLAVLDATPESDAEGSPWLERPCGIDENEFGMGVMELVHEFKAILGRPPGAYGVTPLAIFREVGDTRI